MNSVVSFLLWTLSMLPYIQTFGPGARCREATHGPRSSHHQRIPNCLRQKCSQPWRKAKLFLSWPLLFNFSITVIELYFEYKLRASPASHSEAHFCTRADVVQAEMEFSENRPEGQWPCCCDLSRAVIKVIRTVKDVWNLCIKGCIEQIIIKNILVFCLWELVNLSFWFICMISKNIPNMIQNYY